MSKPAPSQPSERQEESNLQYGQTGLRELHGGKVNALTDAYLLTGDAEEHARLDAQHAAISLMLDQSPAILDIGTGSGAWAIAIAKQFPDADVLGLDLVHVNASSERPSNCRFEICDANEDLDRYPSDSFNLVHIRLALQGVKNYHKLFGQVHRMLRPGGVLLVLEAAFAVFDANKGLILAEKPDDAGFTWYHRIAGMFNQATLARNPSFAGVERVHELLSEMGSNSWESVSDFSFFMPLGPWPLDPIERQSGELMRNSVICALVSVRPALIRFGVAPEEADSCAEKVEVELKGGKIQQYLKFYQSWAVKKVSG